MMVVAQLLVLMSIILLLKIMLLQLRSIDALAIGLLQAGMSDVSLQRCSVSLKAATAFICHLGNVMYSNVDLAPMLLILFAAFCFVFQHKELKSSDNHLIHLLDCCPDGG